VFTSLGDIQRVALVKTLVSGFRLLQAGESGLFSANTARPSLETATGGLGMRIESVGIAVSAVPRQARCLP